MSRTLKIASRPNTSSCWLLSLLFFCHGIGLRLESAEPLSQLNISPGALPKQWQFSFPTELGKVYQLERSSNLSTWDQTAKITSGSISSQLTGEETGNDRHYWRVRLLGDPFASSPVKAVYRMTGAQSSAVAQVTTSGYASAENVVFFADGVALGDATPGLENTWTFSVAWDGVTPQTATLGAQVTDPDGATSALGTRRFLLADPTKFIPADPSTGSRRPGEFVELDATQRLGAFFFHPEGYPAPEKAVGAHFALPAGAQLLFPSQQLEFRQASFFRSAGDTAPLTVTGTTARTLPIAGVSASAVRQAMAVPTTAPLELLLGSSPISWKGGRLDKEGWSSTQVDLPLGSILFPDQHLMTQVVFDPTGRKTSIVARYHGDWRPFGQSGPLFRVPQASPLSIRINNNNEITAKGTVEADFGSGTTLKGSVSWNRPNLDLAFEGKNFSIPALGSLRTVLPTNGSQAVAAAITTNTNLALDTAQNSLAEFQKTLDGFANAAAHVTPNSSTTETAAPVNGDISANGSAAQTLTAWAARLRSWTTDRPGQFLPASDVTQLISSIESSVKGAEAAVSITDVAAVWDGVLVIDQFKSAIASGQLTALNTAILSAGNRLVAIRQRLLQRPPPVSLDELAANKLPADLPPPSIVLKNQNKFVGEGSGLDSRDVTLEQIQVIVQAVASSEVNKKYGDFFGLLKIANTGPVNTEVIDTHDVGQLVSDIEVLADIFVIYREKFRPQPAIQDVTNFPILGTYAALSVAIPPKLVEFQNAALASGDLKRVQDALELELRYHRAVRLLESLEPNSPTPPLPNTLAFIPASIQTLVTNLPMMLPTRRQPLITRHVGLITDLAKVLLHPQLKGQSLAQLAGLNAQATRLAQVSTVCGELENVLKSNPYFPLRPLPSEREANAEGLPSGQQLPISGRYEATTGPNTRTLQVNRAGRYVYGRLQEHVAGQNTSGFEFEGLLLGAESAGQVSFSCVQSDMSGSGLTNLKLTAEVSGSEMFITLLEQPSNQSRRYKRVSVLPMYSHAFGGRMHGKVKEIFEAQNEAPLSILQQQGLNDNFMELHRALLKLHADRNSSLISLRRLNAVNADKPIYRMLSGVSRQQRVLVEQIIRQRLSAISEQEREDAPSSQTSDRLRRVQPGEQSQWMLLQKTFATRNLLVEPTLPSELMPGTVLLMGGEVLPDNSAPVFTYSVTINKTTLPLPVTVGGLTFEIVRTGGNREPETMQLVGLFGQIGAGLPIEKVIKRLKTLAETLKNTVSGGTGSDDIVVTSHVFYTEQDFAGPLLMGSFGGAIPVPPNPLNDYASSASAGLGALTLIGPISHGKPALILPLPITSTAQEVNLKIALEATIAVGAIVKYSEFEGEADVLETTEEPLKNQGEKQLSAVGGPSFDNNSSVLTPCGWQQLRLFVADHRAIFNDPGAKFTLIGLTDTTASDQHNLTLSQNRIISVADALTKILGHPPGLPPSGIGDVEDFAPAIRLLPLGEGPARSDVPLPSSLTDAERNLLEALRSPQALGTRPVDQPTSVPGWRTVKVLLNNTVYLDLPAL